MKFVGLNVSQRIPPSAQSTRKISRLARKTDSIALATVIASHAPDAKRIGLETVPLSTQLQHAPQDLGLPLSCLGARHAKAGLSVQVNKTDENDTLGLAQLVRTGWYRDAKVKSLDSHLVRGVPGARAQLVSRRIHLTTTIRGLLKNFGVFVAVGTRQHSLALPGQRSVHKPASQRWSRR